MLLQILAVGNVVASEASVERAFAKQKFLYRKQRNRMTEANVNAALSVALNYVALFGDEEAQRAQEERATKRQRAARRHGKKEADRVDEICKTLEVQKKP
jgi:hypothetical protein